MKSKDEQDFLYDISYKEFGRYFDNLWTDDIDEDVPILTDNFAPVDQYLAEVL